MKKINLSQELVELENELHSNQREQKEKKHQINKLKHRELELVNEIMAIEDVLKINQPTLKKSF